MSLAEELGFDFESEPCINFPVSVYPCRKCLPCLIKRQKLWVSRLVEELRHHEGNFFVTLTYDESHLPADENGEISFNKRHLQKLNADLRKRFQQGFFRVDSPFIVDSPVNDISLPDVKFKYYIASEYGGKTYRSHYHALYYNLNVDLYTAQLLFQTLWSYGFVSVFPAESGAAGYISKYLVADSVGKDSYHSETTMHPFIMCSKGLGLSYVDRMKSWHNDDPDNRQFTQYHGEKGCMDRYLRKKIFSDSVRIRLGEEVAEKSIKLREKYRLLREQDSERYVLLMRERSRYFEQLQYDTQQRINKKQTLK